MTGFDELRAVLRSECVAVSAVLSELAPGELAQPTRLAPWDVAHLVAHLYRDFEHVPESLAQAPAAGPAQADSVTYWRAYEPTENAVRTQTRAAAYVERFGPDGVIAAFDGMWRTALEGLDAVEPELIVPTWGPAMRIDEFAVTRLVEVVVHGLDLTSALDRPPVADPGAMAIVTQVLAGLAGGRLPDGLGWAPVALVEKATGRTRLTDVDRRILGARADLFPLLV